MANQGESDPSESEARERIRQSVLARAKRNSDRVWLPKDTKGPKTAQITRPGLKLLGIADGLAEYCDMDVVLETPHEKDPQQKVVILRKRNRPKIRELFSSAVFKVMNELQS